MERTERTKPAYEAKLNGVRLAVWENETDGRRWHSAAPSRRFVDPSSKEPKYTATFNGVADLCLLREAINQAIDWMNGRDLGGDEE
ncbi:MAG TPA: hypothetical protein VGN12_00930 [Pirellulales bacterium]